MINTKNYSGILSIAFLLFLSFAACNQIPGAKEGRLAPDFTFKDIHEIEHQLSAYRGKVVLVHFWTDWCNSCRAEFPRVQDIYADLKSDDFELLAVNVGQAASVSKTFQKDFEVTFPMLVDEQKISQDLYQIEGYPTNFFINPEGKIVRIITGWVPKKQVEVFIKQNKTPGEVAKN